MTLLRIPRSRIRRRPPHRVVDELAFLENFTLILGDLFGACGDLNGFTLFHPPHIGLVMLPEAQEQHDLDTPKHVSKHSFEAGECQYMVTYVVVVVIAAVVASLLHHSLTVIGTSRFGHELVPRVHSGAIPLPRATACIPAIAVRTT